MLSNTKCAFQSATWESHYAPRLWDFLGNCCHCLAIRYCRQCHESQGACRALIRLDTRSGGNYPPHSLTLHPPSGLTLRELLLRDHTRKSVPFLWLAQWPLPWPENSCIYDSVTTCLLRSNVGGREIKSDQKSKDRLSLCSQNPPQRRRMWLSGG